jgi:hypothetical protein
MRRTLLPLAILAAFSLSLQAKPAWVKKAQALGFNDIQNCQSCHAAKPPALGPLGQWLKDEKTKRNAKDIDLNWIKDYKKPA